MFAEKWKLGWAPQFSCVYASVRYANVDYKSTIIFIISII